MKVRAYRRGVPTVGSATSDILLGIVIGAAIALTIIYL